MSTARYTRGSFWNGLRRRDSLTDLKWALFGLILFTVLYFAAYSSEPNVPVAHPTRGWEGWWDQGSYLRSARAFAAGDFSASEHFYPPGYSILAAPFVSITPENPFLIPNFIGFIFFYFGFLRLCKNWMPPPLAIACFGFGILVPGFLLKQFIYPWNTIPTAGLMIWIMALVNESAQDRRLRQDVAIGFMVGMVTAIRQAEIIVLLPSGLYYLYNRVAGRAWANVAVAATISAVPPILVALVVLKISGSLTLPYVASVAMIGFSASDFLTRAIFLFLDAHIFNEPASPIRIFQPVVVTLLPFSVLAVFLDWRKFAVAVTSCLATYVLYTMFNDFSPLNIIRYFLVHYILWTFPVIIASGVAGIGAALRHRYKILPLTLGLTGSLFLMLVEPTVQPDDSHQVSEISPPRCGSFILSSGNPDKIDAIDFEGTATSGALPVSLVEANIKADGQPLRLFRDYRFMTVDQGLRLVFFSYMRPRELSIQLPENFFNPPCSPDKVKPQRLSLWK